MIRARSPVGGNAWIPFTDAHSGETGLVSGQDEASRG